MNGSTHSVGTLLVLRAVSEPTEEPHGHLVLEDLGNENYVVGYEDCLHLPMGIMHYDPELETFELTSGDDEELLVDEADTGSEVEEIENDEVNEGVFVLIGSGEGFHDEAVAKYAAYKEVVEFAAGFEAEDGDYTRIEGIYPEVVDQLENLLCDPLGLLDPAALLAAAQYMVNDGIEDQRHREIAMGLFLDLYADAFGAEPCCDEVELEGNEFRLCFTAGRLLSPAELVDALGKVIESILSDPDDEPVRGFVFESDELPPEADETAEVVAETA